MANTQVFTDVMDFTVERYDADKRGEILFSVDYASETTITSDAERLDILGGIGNYRLLSVDHSRTVGFNAKLPLVDLVALGEKLGSPLTTGVKISTKNEYVKAVGDNLTLKETPYIAAGADKNTSIKVHVVEGDRDMGTELTFGAVSATGEYTHVDATKVIGLFAGDYPDGTLFFVSYEYQTGANTKSLTITGNDFPGFLRITGRGQVTDDVTGTLVPVSFDIKKAKVEPSFELTMTAGSNTEIDFTCDCFAVAGDSACEKVFVEILRLNDESTDC